MSKPWNEHNFWRLTLGGGDQEGTMVDKYDLDPYVEVSLWDAPPVDPATLKDVKLWVLRNGPLFDYFANPISWHILSDRFVGMLRELGVKDEYELFPAPLFDEESKQPIAGYSIFHALRPIDCLDKPRSRAEYKEELGCWFTINIHLHGRQIPEDARVFRVGELSNVIVFRGDVVAEYYKRGYTGAWFLHLPTENEEYIDEEHIDTEMHS